MQQERVEAWDLLDVLSRGSEAVVCTLTYRGSTAVVPQMIDRNVGGFPFIVRPGKLASMLADVNRLCMSVWRCATSVRQFDGGE